MTDQPTVAKHKHVNLYEMQQANKRVRQNWFNPGAIDFFNSIVEKRPNYFNFFITSERENLDRPKGYTIRFFNHVTSNVETVGDSIMMYSTIIEAEKVRDAIQKYLVLHLRDQSEDKILSVLNDICRIDINKINQEVLFTSNSDTTFTVKY